MLDREMFLTEYRLEKDFESCGFDWEELEAIYDDYSTKEERYRNTATALTRLFSEAKIQGKHSVGYRIKDAKHLIEKLIRKTVDGNTKKYNKINRHNYESLVTDLIGVRILMLNKECWEGIHEYIMSRFENNPSAYIDLTAKDYNFVDNAQLMQIAEQPIVYIRYGDKDIFKKKLITKYTNKDYRSQHYIVKFSNVYCEIQVRTLAEEVYGEFDHQIRYPYKKDNKFLKHYTSMLSKITVAADEILSLCAKLPEEIIDKCHEFYDDAESPDFPLKGFDQLKLNIHNRDESAEEEDDTAHNILEHAINKVKRDRR